MKRKFFSLMLAMLLVVASVGTIAHAEQRVKLKIDGKYVDSDVDPFIENGRTLVPLRIISETLGYKVTWVEKTREVIITSGDKTMILNIDNADSTIDGRGVTLDVPPRLVNARTFVPIRFIAEEFNKNVDCDEETWTVMIGNDEGSSEISRIYAALALLRKNAIANSREYPDASYVVPYGNASTEYIMDVEMYRFDYVEDHDTHIVTVDRYAVDLETERVYMYNLTQDRWIEL